MRERCLDDALHRPKVGPATRPNATSAESTCGRGRKTVRETGWKPTCARQLHEHRDRAVRLRPRLGEEAVRDLPLHHHAPDPERRHRPSRLSTTSGVATLYGRFATSFRGAGRGPRDRARARRRTRARRSSARASASRSGASRDAIELDRVDDSNAVGQVAREHAEAGPDLEHHVRGSRPASRPITPRMFWSTRKCWPSAFFGVTVTGAGEGRSRVRVGQGGQLVGGFVARARRARRR